MFDAAEWVEINGQWFSPAAADLHRRSVPFSAEAACDRCMGCSGTRWWRLRAGCPWVCANCSPSNRAEHGLEWRDGAHVGEAGDTTSIAAPTEGSKTIRPPSECRSCGSLLSWLRVGESAWRCRECEPLPDGEAPALLGRLEDGP
jgi:ribosomal protein L37AE/L43A